MSKMINMEKWGSDLEVNPAVMKEFINQGFIKNIEMIDGVAHAPVEDAYIFTHSLFMGREEARLAKKHSESNIVGDLPQEALDELDEL